MTIILSAVTVVAAVVSYIFRTLHQTHMFQLNSYRPERQLKWFKKNISTYIIPTAPYVVSFVLSFLFKESNVGLIVSTALFVIGAVLNIPKKAKKPLVYTARVKRLLSINALFMIGWVIGVCVAGDISKVFTTAASVILIISPALFILCSYIVLPVEKSISNHYVKDAENIINNHKSLVTIGVTGSYGKTSVKYMLGTLLEAKYNVLITPESYNTPMGVTRTIRENLRATHDIFVCEMGAKQVGDIKEICDIVHPDHGVITSVGPQHLETFKTLDNVKKTKFELEQSIPKIGKLFVNGEDENILSYNKRPGTISYGLNSNCTYFADNISVSSKGTTFTISKDGETVEFTTSLLGKHSVINLVGAIAVSCEMGIPMSKLPPYVRKVNGVEHRLQLMKRGNITIIDDAYNSNPSGSSAALDVLSLFEGTKVVITPGMIELGDVQDEENKKFGMHIAEVCDYVVLVKSKQTDSIYAGLMEKNFDKDKIYIADNLQSGANNAFAYGNSCAKTVLFENDLPDNF